MYKLLEKTEKIRILIGISTNKEVFELIQKAKEGQQPLLQFSHAEVKKQLEELVAEEMEQSEDNPSVEEKHNKNLRATVWKD